MRRMCPFVCVVLEKYNNVQYTHTHIHEMIVFVVYSFLEKRKKNIDSSSYIIHAHILDLNNYQILRNE